jgi:hypothetical protein
MAVILKTQKSAVVDALRAVRNADDEISRLKENSWENQQRQLASLVESSEWRHGPAELLATFPHHVLAKARTGSVIQVEWASSEDGITLGRAVVHEMATPVADLGQELMETAKAAVDHILDEDFDAAEPMIETIAEALDSGGDLQRRVQNEITVRSLKRDAWWHQMVGVREEIENLIPQPELAEEDGVARSVNGLLIFLKEAAGDAATSIRALDTADDSADLVSLAADIAEDAQRAVAALSNVDIKNQDEALQIYEAVMAATPRLLNGIAFLNELAQEPDPAQQG